MEYMSFWWGKILVEFSIIIGVLLLIFVYAFVRAGIDHFKQSRCKHDRYYETMACRAICSKCKKDLGFIGTVRKQRSKSD